MLQVNPMFALISFLDLSFQDVIANIPRDAGAVVAFTLMALFIGFIWIGSRPKGGKPDRPTRAK